MATAIAPASISSATAAETYPVKPVRIVVAVGPGGADDFAARQVASKLGELLGQPFIVENRPGAGGMIGQTFVAKSSTEAHN
jgi:tripartite-type tricarboxylate transporter receptor subunit TctC